MAYFIGLMSGTSLDSIDAVIAQFEPEFALIASHSEALPTTLKQQIQQLMQPGNNEIDLMGEVDLALGRLFAQASNTLIQKVGLSAAQINAIGCHGQTIRHRPEAGFTLQIGSPSSIAELTGITTIADFRNRDMAAGGEGAPLVPAFHQALFRSKQTNRCIVNIGGMANITILPADPHQAVTGFDTGPGNILLDGWNQQHQGSQFDNKGRWAASGAINPIFLQALLNLDYFSTPPPKSTGREQFNPKWLQSILNGLPETLTAVDVQRTLVELTSISIANDIKRYAAQTTELFICGGGSHNLCLLDSLATQLPNIQITTTDYLSLDADWVEAAAFAWLAYRCINRETGNLASVTGAQGDRILGAIYPA